jgi:hypothetical protein
MVRAETVLVIATMRGSHRACGHFGDPGHRLLLHRRPVLYWRQPTSCGVDLCQPVPSIEAPGADNPEELRAVWS